MRNGVEVKDVKIVLPEKGVPLTRVALWHMRTSVYGALHQAPRRDGRMQGIGLC